MSIALNDRESRATRRRRLPSSGAFLRCWFARRAFRSLQCGVGALLFVPHLAAAQVPGVPVDRQLQPLADASPRDLNLATIDAGTRWAFRTLPSVVVNSPIIRVGDVVRPIDAAMEGWERIRRATIALVPLNGQPMILDRSRLHQAIIGAEATPVAIDWVGPEKIRVEYSPRPQGIDSKRRTTQHPSSTQTPGRLEALRPKVARALYDSPFGPDTSHVSQVSGTKEPLSASQRARVTQWVKNAIARYDPSLFDEFEVELASAQIDAGKLNRIVGIQTIEMLKEPAQGDCRVHLECRDREGPMQAEVTVTLKAHPRVVTPRKSLAKGHRVQSQDLVFRPLPANELQSSHVTDPDQIIGMEVRTSLRANRPIEVDSLTSPVLVHRGDLLEVRVVGGGITVTTNAKALGNGSASDLVEVETMRPRKRVIARVVSPGIVEIITRAPRVPQ